MSLTENQNRTPVNIEDEMKRSYLDYAMSVIIGRALPDVRDGLKPAHRRVLFAMRQMGLAVEPRVPQVREGHRRSHRQLPSARRRVGLRHAGAPGAGLQHAQDPGRRPGQLRLGRRRPARRLSLHGSAARGDCREPDGGPRHATRSTSSPTSTRPPPNRRSFPTTYPNLLVNGSTGIAVGMATNIPPHNLRRGDRRRRLGDREHADGDLSTRRSCRASRSCRS